MFLFDPEAALARVEEKGDLFEPVLKLKQALPKTFLAKLEKVSEANSVDKQKKKQKGRPAQRHGHGGLQG